MPRGSQQLYSHRALAIKKKYAHLKNTRDDYYDAIINMKDCLRKKFKHLNKLYLNFT